MEAPIIAALIAAFVAVLGGSASLYATYRLKVKEFRVAQIKSRIDTLEQAAVSVGPESNPQEDKTEEDQDALRAIEVALNAASHRLKATEEQYSKYKWLLNPQSHESIAKLLEACNELFRKLGVAKAMHNFQNASQDIPPFIGKTEELRKAYEQARLSAIERLYFVLNKEVGI